MADETTNPLAALRAREAEIETEIHAITEDARTRTDALRVELRRTRSAIRSLLGTRERRDGGQ